MTIPPDGAFLQTAESNRSEFEQVMTDLAAQLRTLQEQNPTLVPMGQPEFLEDSENYRPYYKEYPQALGAMRKLLSSLQSAKDPESIRSILSTILIEIARIDMFKKNGDSPRIAENGYDLTAPDTSV